MAPKTPTNAKTEATSGSLQQLLNLLEKRVPSVDENQVWEEFQNMANWSNDQQKQDDERRTLNDEIVNLEDEIRKLKGILADFDSREETAQLFIKTLIEKRLGHAEILNVLCEYYKIDRVKANKTNATSKTINLSAEDQLDYLQKLSEKTSYITTRAYNTDNNITGDAKKKVGAALYQLHVDGFLDMKGERQGRKYQINENGKKRLAELKEQDSNV